MFEHDVPRIDDNSVLVGAQTEFIVRVDTEVVWGKKVTAEKLEVGPRENSEGQQVIDTPGVADSQNPGLRHIAKSVCNLGIPMPDRKPVVGQLYEDLAFASPSCKVPSCDAALITLLDDDVSVCTEPRHRIHIVAIEGKNMFNSVRKFGSYQPAISCSYSPSNTAACSVKKRYSHG